MENNKNILIQKIEAVLFYVAEPVMVKYLAEMLEVTQTEINEAVKEMARGILATSGLCIIEHDGTLALTTRPEMSDVIEKIIKDEHERDLGRASLETLAIISYRGPISRKEIEYIRGVNCQFSIRTLLLRGLIDKGASANTYAEGSPEAKKNDSRVVLYSVTIDALRHLGLEKISDLPEYASVNKKLIVEELEEPDLT